MLNKFKLQISAGETAKGLLIGLVSMVMGILSWNEVQTLSRNGDVAYFLPKSPHELPLALKNFYEDKWSDYPNHSSLRVSADWLHQQGYLDEHSAKQLGTMNLFFHLPWIMHPGEAQFPGQILIEANLDPQEKIVLLADGSVHTFSLNRWNYYLMDSWQSPLTIQ